MRYVSKLVLGIAATVMLAGTVARADAFRRTFEAPGVQNTTISVGGLGAGGGLLGVETFDTRPDEESFSTTFGTGGAIIGRYTPLAILEADGFGGAGGIGRYAGIGEGYGLNLNTTLASGINYFGLWLSALDVAEELVFYRNTVRVGAISIDPNDPAFGRNPVYYGNPNANFLQAQGMSPYVFVNIFDLDGNFDQVRFIGTQGLSRSGSDNHTAGHVVVVAGSVPETRTWAMMILGAGIVGRRLRRAQRRVVATG